MIACGMLAVQKCLEIHGLELFVDYRGGFGKHIDSWTAAPVGDQSKKNESVERMISLGTHAVFKS